MTDHGRQIGKRGNVAGASLDQGQGGQDDGDGRGCDSLVSNQIVLSVCFLLSPVGPA